jgi:hypothetical protein
MGRVVWVAPRATLLQGWCGHVVGGSPPGRSDLEFHTDPYRAGGGAPTGGGMVLIAGVALLNRRVIQCPRTGYWGRSEASMRLFA